MLNVLVVDDNIFFSKILINKLLQANSNLRLCMIATDGKEAIDILKKQKIDIILLDLKLPIYSGLDILDFLKTNKKSDYCNSIIAISGEADMIIKIKNNPLIYTFLNKCTDIDIIVKEICGLAKIKEKELELKQHKKEVATLTKNKILHELTTIGYNLKYDGTKYLTETILILSLSKNKRSMKLEKDIYPILSDKHNKTVNTIKCDIIRATNQIMYDIDNTHIKKYFGCFWDKKITPKLVINTVLQKIS